MGGGINIIVNGVVEDTRIIIINDD